MKAAMRMFIGLASLLVPAAPIRAAAGEVTIPTLGISITSDRTAFTDGAYVHWRLTITNLTSKPVVLPSFWLVSTNKAMKPSPGVNHHVLKVDLKQGSRPVPAKEPWRTLVALVERDPPRELPPGGVIHEAFMPWEFAALPGAGEYSLSMIVDTTTCRDPKVTKGKWVSLPTTFRITPRLTFRSKSAGESAEEYAQARVNFFLKHSTPDWAGLPLYFHEITSTEGAVPALIELSYSSDKDTATRASAVLRGVGPWNQRALPDSKPAWLDWWRDTGSKLKDWQLWERSAIQ